MLYSVDIALSMFKLADDITVRDRAPLQHLAHFAFIPLDKGDDRLAVVLRDVLCFVFGVALLGPLRGFVELGFSFRVSLFVIVQPSVRLLVLGRRKLPGSRGHVFFRQGERVRLDAGVCINHLLLISRKKS